MRSASVHDFLPWARTARSRAPSILVSALLTLAVVPSPAAAIPGPDPADAPPEFSIVVYGTHAGETEIFDMLDFSRADGWDFGDREAYRCAFVEYIVNDEVQFTLTFDRLTIPGHDAGYITISDRHGMELEGNAPECGYVEDGSGIGQTWDGSPFVPGGASFTVYKDTVPLVVYALPGVSPVNVETFWSVGDEPGEAYMWYVEEGEANDAVVRFTITPIAPGVSLSSEPAPEPEPEPLQHRARVILKIQQHITLFGRVRIPDGTEACRGRRTVVIERRASGKWNQVGIVRTAAAGDYRTHVRPRDGTYRARAMESTLVNGEICASATSRTRVYERA